MSTTNPDEIRATIRHRLIPAAFPLAIIGVLSAPVLAAINVAGGGNVVWTFIAYVGVSVGFGLFGYYVIRPTPWVIAAYSVQYVGGLFLVLSSGVPLGDDTSVIYQGFWIVALPYVVAAVFLVLWGLRRSAVAGTRARGINTTATVESIGVDGQVNYVQHERMTLSFTDDKGTKRYFRTGITGGYYHIGDKIPIRYDPEHPDSKRAILVGGQPYVSPDQQP
jgi:hypothetical protein